MVVEAGGSEHKTESGVVHTRINHFFELSIDELEKFVLLVATRTTYDLIIALKSLKE